MPIRGEGRFPKIRLGKNLGVPPGPPPVPTPLPIIDDAPPAPDYASPQYPTPPVVDGHRPRGGLTLMIVAVLLLWCAAAGVVAWRLYHPIGSSRAETPEEALRVFVRGLGDGDTALMRAAARYRNPDWTDTLLQIMAENHGLERDFEERGEEAPVHIALPLGWSLPAHHDLHHDDYTLRQNGRTATLEFHGRLTGYNSVGFVKQGLYWYVDLRPFEPMGHERELARALAVQWYAILSGARQEVHDPDSSPASVQRALYATTLEDTGDTNQANVPPLEPPLGALATTTPAEPLLPGDPLHSAVRRVTEAIHQGNYPGLQALVAPDSTVRFSSGVERAFWEVYTPEALERMAQETPPQLTEIVPVDRGLSETTLRVTTSTDLGDAHTRYTFRNQDGYWLLFRVAPESY
jgi:hypothetical protein